MLIGGLVFPIFTQAWRYRLPLNSLNLLALFGLIVVGAILSHTLFLKGISMVGPLKGSLLAAIEPVASVILAALILGQVFYQMDILGMLFIVLAVLIISLISWLFWVYDRQSFLFWLVLTSTTGIVM